MFLDQMSDDLSYFEEQLVSKNLESSVGEILRRLHSNKGSAGALGYNVISDVIHSIEESLLDRKSAQHIEPLLAKVDVLKKLINLSRNSKLTRPQFLAEYEKIGREFKSQASFSQKFKVLIVDTSATTFNYLVKNSKLANVELNSCSNGLTALNKVIHEKYSIVVCGAVLHELDGPALIAAIKINESTSRVKTVIMSSNRNLKMLIQPDFIISRSNTEYKQILDWIEQLSLVASAA
ncbi:MAG TPA: Hpt domain-containing protein [Oligoflexus sp.]|uniref:Hpt domain-containing protein n=1 Tax=Oligoflexus sp. TaxID=1971216 RepID=UPI002D42C88E|nr:Hpt domain-containing protein [Oligoflexus sp.]HYX33158.1 Hpt domain-containing protein [Oligoflexus sp.]